MSASSPTPAAVGSPKPPIARTARACSSCSRQKLRCDGARPCARCTALGAPDSCEYLPSMRGKTRKRKTVPAVLPTAASGPVAPTPIQDALGAPAKRTRFSPPSSTEASGAASGTLKPEYSMWHRSSALARYGPRNSVIWKDVEATSPEMEPGFSPASALSGDSQREGRIADRLTTLPLPGDMPNPLAVLAQASATVEGDEEEVLARSPERAAPSGEPERERSGYYAPVQRVLLDEAPHIMSLINVHEAETLFALYHKHLHHHLPVLDVAHSSPAAVARRNNFLFNAICCVAARSFNVVLWERLKEFARFEVERLPKEKNIDVVQGHLLYSTWNLFPPSSFERDQTWLRVGLTTRTAIDINLHRVAHIRQARDGLPRWMLRSIVRTWLMTYVTDSTLSAQLGKPPIGSGEAGVGVYVKLLMERQSDEPPSADDVLVASLAEWTLILTRAMTTFGAEALESPESSMIAPDMVQVLRQQFQHWRERAEGSAQRWVTDPHDMGFVLGTFRLYDNYARLVVQSFGLERALEHQSINLPAEFAEYQQATVRLIKSFESDQSSPNLARGCPDFAFNVITYGAVSLLKALDRRFAHIDPPPNKDQVLALARTAADLLARAAVTADHVPASQSVFLSRLIQAKSKPPRVPRPAPPVANGRQEQPGEPVMDFEAFGASVAEDESKTLWPPWGFISRAASPTLGARMWEPLQASPASDTPADLASWVAQQSENLALPGPALGLGVGSFGTESDLLFTQDAFWHSILSSTGPPGMV